MNFNEYQEEAKTTHFTKGQPNDLFHLILGLAGESGEIAEKFKKLVRDHSSDESKVDKDDLKKELGDVMWYIAILADYFDIKLEDVAKTNIDKLADRAKRNVLKGSGDNR